jgi:hypothetical protein
VIHMQELKKDIARVALVILGKKNSHFFGLYIYKVITISSC